MGGSPTTSPKRAEKAERDMAAPDASSAIQVYFDSAPFAALRGR